MNSKTTKPTGLPRIKIVLAALAIGAIALTGTVVAQTAPAEAMTEATGWSEVGFIGAHRSDEGTLVYCIDNLYDPPLGNVPMSVTTVGGWAPRSGTVSIAPGDLQQLNAALRTFGNTGDNNQAAAMEAITYAYSRSSPPDAQRGINIYEYRAPSHASTIRPYFDAIWNWMHDPANVVGSASGSGSATFAVDRANNYNGTLTVNLNPGDARATVTLTNGRFTSTGTATATNIQNGQVLAVVGVPPAGSPNYKISASGTATYSQGSSATVTMWESTDPSYQRMIAGGGPSTGTFAFSAVDPTFRRTDFVPVVNTNVASQFVNPGDEFIDVVTFSAIAQPDGTNNSWFRYVNGTYAPVKATGVLYGPFSTKPIQSPTVPAGAPVAGTAVVTSSPSAGPDVPTPVNSGIIAASAGYYTWVWSIDYAEQSSTAPNVQAYIPVDYAFDDAFGLVAETHIMPFAVEATSEVTAPEVALSSQIQDQITVTQAGVGDWFTDDTGAFVPVTFRGTAYSVPGDTAPAVSADVPAGTAVVGTTTVIATGPGVYLSPELTAPDTGPGYITWVWEVLTADQTPEVQNRVVPWKDQFGLAAETQRLLEPKVVTQAQEFQAVGLPLVDFAMVSGTLPATASGLYFSVYKAIEGETSPTCVAADPAVPTATPTATDNLVFTTIGQPVPITAAGETESAPFTPESPGVYYWVETLLSDQGNVIAQGECGIANETSKVSQLIVSSKATKNTVAGDQAFDTAIITGTIPEGATVGFEAYRRGTVTTATCLPAERVFVSEPQTLKPGLVVAFEVESKRTVFDTAGAYDWVETVRLADGTELNRGVCGAPTEKTTVVPKTIAYTGSGGVAALAPVAAGFLGLGTLLFLVFRKRNRGRHIAL